MIYNQKNFLSVFAIMTFIVMVSTTAITMTHSNNPLIKSMQKFISDSTNKQTVIKIKKISQSR